MTHGMHTPDDLAAIEQVPLAQRHLPPSTYAAIERGANQDLAKIGLQFFLQGPSFTDAFFYTYQDIMALINQMANLLHDFGLQPDEVVSLALPNLPQTLFAQFGAQAAGIAHPIDPALDPVDMAAAMNAVGTRVLVTLAPFAGSEIWAKVASIANDVPTLELILRVDPANYLGFFSRMALRLGGKPRTAPVNALTLDFGKECHRYPANERVSPHEIAPDTTAVIHTTPALNQIRLSHANLVTAAWAFATAVQFDSHKVTFAGLPYHHPTAALVSGLVPWMAGASIVVGTPLGFAARGVVGNFWFIADYFKLNVIHATPDLFAALVARPSGETAVDTLQLLLCDGGPLPAPTRAALQQRGAGASYDLIGHAETGGITALAPHRPAANGFLRVPYLQWRVQDAASGQVCQPGETGRLWVRGPAVAHPVAHSDAQNWSPTGDSGYLAADGLLHVTQRHVPAALRVDLSRALPADSETPSEH